MEDSTHDALDSFRVPQRQCRCPPPPPDLTRVDMKPPEYANDEKREKQYTTHIRGSAYPKICQIISP